MYKEPSKNPMRIFEFTLLDLLCLHFAFLAAYFLRHGICNPYDLDVYRYSMLFLTVADVVTVCLLSTYKDVLYRNKYDELKSTIKHTTILISLAALFLFSMQYAMDYSRITFYVMSGLYFTINYFARIILKKILRKNTHKNMKRSLLLMVAEADAEQAIQNINSCITDEYSIHGIVFLDNKEIKAGEEHFGVKAVADLGNVSQYVVKNCVDEVLVIPNSDTNVLNDVISELSKTGVVIHLNIDYPKKVYGNTRFIEKVAQTYTVTTICMNSASPLETIIKRGADIIGGFVGCIITGILCIFLAPIIKIASPGSLFFSQERVGINGRVFKMYKFRSMIPDADGMKKDFETQNKIEGGLMFKMDFDPRVIGNKILPDGTYKTGIGEFIRKTSLDEFPQFFNVLTGSMSLVGTRPPTLDEYKEYDLHHKARLAIKPGITGMWQTSGRSEITDFEEVIALDTEYINNWSLGLDAKILLKTISSVIKRDGAV